MVADVLLYRKSVRGRVFLAGTSGYFHVQYFMYLGRATYNELFLPPSLLAGWSYGKGQKAALVLIPVLLGGAVAAAILSLKHCREETGTAGATPG